MVKKMPKPTKWTDEVIQFIIENYQGKDNIELAELLNKRFNLNTNGDRVSNVKANLKRRKGINLNTGINKGCIKKGNVPFNKGKKMSKEQYNKCKNTMFKKGNVPPNHRPIGSERITVDGFVEIKVAEPNRWKAKARVIYEKEFGTIPEGYIIIYLDGNKQNLEPNNLKAISRKENLIMNHNKLRYNNKETTETALTLAKLMGKVGLR